MVNSINEIRNTKDNIKNVNNPIDGWKASNGENNEI